MILNKSAKIYKILKFIFILIIGFIFISLNFYTLKELNYVKTIKKEQLLKSDEVAALLKEKQELSKKYEEILKHQKDVATFLAKSVDINGTVKLSQFIKLQNDMKTLYKNSKSFNEIIIKSNKEYEENLKQVLVTVDKTNHTLSTVMDKESITESKLNTIKLDFKNVTLDYIDYKKLSQEHIKTLEISNNLLKERLKLNEDKIKALLEAINLLKNGKNIPYMSSNKEANTDIFAENIPFKLYQIVDDNKFYIKSKDGKIIDDPITSESIINDQYEIVLIDSKNNQVHFKDIKIGKDFTLNLN